MQHINETEDSPSPLDNDNRSVVDNDEDDEEEEIRGGDENGKNEESDDNGSSMTTTPVSQSVQKSRGRPKKAKSITSQAIETRLKKTYGTSDERQTYIWRRCRRIGDRSG